MVQSDQRARAWRTFGEYTKITLATLLVSTGVFFFMLPSHVAVGSCSALAMILSNFIPLPVSVLSLALNVVLLVIGFFTIGAEFGVKTVYVSVLSPLFLGAYELLLPNFETLTDEPMLDVLCYILVVGLAMAILFSCNASSGGLDIVAKILNKYLRMDLGRAITVSGMTVALSSAICYDKRTVVLSVLGTYFSGMIVDRFIFGLNIKRRVCIISKRLEEITDYIINELHSGATLYEAVGAYDHTPRKEVITIVDKQEYRRLMTFVRNIDPSAFVTVYSVNEINYQPKPRVGERGKNDD